jgi:hypothetical protein
VPRLPPDQPRFTAYPRSRTLLLSSAGAERADERTASRDDSQASAADECDLDWSPLHEAFDVFRQALDRVLGHGAGRVRLLRRRVLHVFHALRAHASLMPS